ncbi:hypothetical protein RB620_14695 [Paenibacillus sp. LHD-117]|uniref:lipopolysaccharide biosynthesis protein n=1 Tax=Paenibacillus sp. LHD-117 TaxID=3071412 RepID=UPI0027E160A5|nr:hypothetical protein [Paenibacillus sp. LHD-117]MDQ6420676.1 hypothetical protein [Paenibacillus sp. LHD-117]
MKEFISRIKIRLNKHKYNSVILNNAIGAFFIKGGSLILSLLTLPAYIKYFENQSILGLWFTMLSVLSWILTFDLGVGNGLRNHLVPALLHKDWIKVKKYITSAYVIVGVLVISVAVVSFFLFQIINWNRIFNISEIIVPQVTLSTTVYIIFIGVILQFFFRIISSVLYAMQKSALNHLLGLFSSIIILVYVWIAEPTNAYISMIQLATVYVIAINAPLLFATFGVFMNSLNKGRPQLRFFDKSYAKDVLKLGGVFLWVQVMYMCITTTNEYLISWLVEPAAVVEYTTYNRIFSLISTVIVLLLTPIWSAVTRAVVEKNHLWINSLYRRLNVLAFIATVGLFCLIPFLHWAFNVWLGESTYKVDYIFALIFASYSSLFIWNGVLSSIANGFGRLKVQSVCFTIGVVIKFPLAWLLVDMMNSWIGVVLANVVAMSIYVLFQPVWIKKWLTK